MKSSFGLFVSAVVMSAGCAAEPAAEESVGSTESAITSGAGVRLEVKNLQSNRCLDLPNGATQPGTPVNQYTCHRGPNQQFSLIRVSLGSFSLATLDGSMCIGVPGLTAPDNTRVVLLPCRVNGDVPLGLRWSLENLTDPNATISQMSFRLASVAGPTDSGACIDVPNGSSAIGLPLQVFHCHGGPDQRFVVTMY